MPLFLPKLGQSMEAATILEWHVGEGEPVTKGQLLVTIETDKATYDLESPGTGRVHIAVPEGEEVTVETLIATIGAEQSTQAPRPSRSTQEADVFDGTVRSMLAARTPGRVLASPKAKSLAAELGVDLTTVIASGSDRVISADDVRAAAAPEPSLDAEALPEVVSTSRREVARRRLTGIRKTSARRLQESWQSIPQIVQMVDVDATGLLGARARLKGQGLDVSVNDLVLQATARALAAVPDLNVKLDGEELVSYQGVDIGFAVETPRGLLVPVVRGADSLSIGQLAAEARRLSDAARESRLKPEDTGSASLSVSNLGAQGIRMGTPVINLGEPALVFVGAIENRPVAIGTLVVVRPTFTLSIAYDHRVADGVLAASFTNALKAAIESNQTLGEGGAPGDTPRSLRSHASGTGYRVDIAGPRGHAWQLDEPLEDRGTDQGPTPVESFLGALLGCMTMSFKAAARRHNIPIERVDGSIVANPRHRLSKIDVRLDVWSPTSETELLALLPAAKKGCFVGAVLKDDIDYRVEVRALGLSSLED